MQKTRSKQNFLLQENSIQALRIMSDNPAIKNELREVFRDKISEISCISEESKKLKDDLMQWLNYRNYEKNEPSKYSKLFIWELEIKLWNLFKNGESLFEFYVICVEIINDFLIFFIIFICRDRKEIKNLLNCQRKLPEMIV